MNSNKVINAIGAAGAAMVASSPLVSLSALAADSTKVTDTLAIMGAGMATAGITLSVGAAFIKYNED